MNDVERTTLLVRLARLIADGSSDQPLEARLCRAYLAMVGGDGAAITLSYTEPSRVTLCTTDDVAARLEDLQDVLGEGPGPTAYQTGAITVSDLRFDLGQWPLFTNAARKIPGVTTVYAVPMRPGDQVIGVMTAHQDSPDLPDRDQAQFLADAIGAALMKDAPHLESELDSGPARAATASRAVRRHRRRRPAARAERPRRRRVDAASARLQCPRCRDEDGPQRARSREQKQQDPSRQS
ncbi:hypothetical protein EV646_11386 [Kribbella antiqua]|uniref:GAF domain-containing protein n=1 Tax=Kribbella antiqua TaxID=2512217 RepID=A0A4R2ID18_9ACTN|nr:GAF domain-containing protein [Kribbella antiqua]TCO42464.1 hypothetical protein EV646_11386 [Kribbella antiqua]